MLLFQAKKRVRARGKIVAMEALCTLQVITTNYAVFFNINN